MVLLRPLGVAFLLLLASCWTPVYKQDLSVAATIRDKLRFDSEMTTSNFGNNTNEPNFYQAFQSYDSSVMVILDSTQHSVAEFLSNNYTNLDFPLPDESMVVAQPSMGAVGWLVPTLTNGTNGRGLVRRSTATGASPDSVPFLTAQTSPVTDLIGFCTTIDDSMNASAFYLTKTTSSGVVTVTLSQDNSTNLSPTATTTLFSVTDATAAMGWMAVNLAGTNGATVYLSHAPDSSGNYVTEVLDSDGQVTRWEGKDHVVAFLSTNRLLTREGSYYNVSDSSGNILYSFPGGTLQFAGEYVDAAGEPMRSRFSEALPISSNNGGNDKLRIRYYSIETSKLDSLQ